MINPLAATKKGAKKPDRHPFQGHAEVHAWVNKMHPSEIQQTSKDVGSGLPILATLASNPNVTRKDVVKAAADTVGEGKMPATKAVELISAMPDKPEDLQPWLKNLFASNLSAQVHMKAAMQPQQQGAQPVAQQGITPNVG